MFGGIKLQRVTFQELLVCCFNVPFNEKTAECAVLEGTGILWSQPMKRALPASDLHPSSTELGQLAQRISAVGPARFGIVTVDCAKHRSVLKMRNALGLELLPTTIFSHTLDGLHQAIHSVMHAKSVHDLGDLIVAIEQTSHFHLPIVKAFQLATLDTRIIHPRISQHYRRKLHHGQKTDVHDLDGIYMAVSQGLGMAPREIPDVYQQLLILIRHRRDLIRRQSKLQQQLRDAAHRYLPGLLDMRQAPWNNVALMTLVRQHASPESIRALGFDGLRQTLLKLNAPTPTKWAHLLLAWANQALDASPQAACWQLRFCDLDDQRMLVNSQIRLIERQEASLLARTPYLLLLAIPGIHIVSAAEYAAEAGPPEHYLHPNQITGRAGLVPSRYQSDRVDYRHGPITKQGHRALRYALLLIAGNLVQHNRHFNARASIWKSSGKHPSWIRIKIAKAFSRISYGIVMSGKILQHPCLRHSQTILEKLLAFHHHHGTPCTQIKLDLAEGAKVIPTGRRTAESLPFKRKLFTLQSKQRGPQSLASILTLVLTRLSEPSPNQEDSTPCQT